MGDLFRAFAIAGAVEEGAKYLAVRVFLYPRGSFRRITDGITTAVAAGLGFAFFENIFYTFGSFETLLLRGLTSVPLHAAASGILGYHLGTQKFSYRPAGPRGLAAAAAVHGLYNFFLFRGSWLSILTVPTVYFALRFVIRAYRRAQALDREEGRD
jgi:RsiW-degrading membrane proteinase PrsW (M82 family)